MCKRLFKKMCVLLLLVLLITGCSQSIESKIEKGKDLIRERDYKEAVEVFESVLEKEEGNYEARFGIVKAYIKDDEYKDAEKELEKLFEFFRDNYGENDEKDNEEIIEDIWDYVEDIEEDSDIEIGDWINALILPTPIPNNTSYNLSEGTKIEFDKPAEGDIYYTIDGKKPTKESNKYKEPIEMEIGNHELRAAIITDFGARSEVYVNEYNVARRPDKPEANYEGGTYENKITIEFTNVDDENTIYYTLDGSYPDEDNGFLYYEGAIQFVSGDYTLRALKISDDGVESEELYEEYFIDNPTVPVGDVSLRVDVHWNDVESIFSDLIYEFESEYPNIQIELSENKETYSALDRLQVEFASGDSPDIIIGFSSLVNDLGDRIRPVTNYMDDNLLKNLATDALESSEVNGDYYIVPIAMEGGLGLLYNKEFIKEEPKNWEELVEMAKKAEDYYGCEGFSYNESHPYWLLGFYNGFGGDVLDDNNNPTLDNQAMVDALSFIIDIKERHDLGFENMEYMSVHDMFKAGECAMIINGSWVLNEYRNSGIDVGIASGLPLPNGEYAKFYNHSMGLMVSDEMYANDYDDDKDKAIKLFIDFCVSNASNNARIGLSLGMAPSSIEARKLPDITMDENMQEIIKFQSNTVGMMNIKEMDAVRNAVSNEIYQVLNYGKSSEQAAKDMQLKAEE